MYILIKRAITITGVVADVAARTADKRNKQVSFKNTTSFTHCISKIDNTLVDKAKDLDVVMSMHNLIEYNNNYVKTSGKSVTLSP